MKREVNKEVKVVWLSRMFYGVSRAYDLNINSYEDLSEFLNAEISSLKWGQDKKEAKKRFTKKYQMLLDLYGIRLSQESVLAELEKENQSTQKAVEHWAEHAEFPGTW